MSNKILTKVNFYQVKNNSAKILLICAKAQEAIQHEKRLIIAAPNLEAAEYIDALLWNTPAESFIPHIISDTYFRVDCYHSSRAEGTLTMPSDY